MKPYNDYNSYLKKRYGCKVYRIGIDAGFSCPNRGSSSGSSGCIYCNENGARSTYTNPKETVYDQLNNRIARLKKDKNAEKFIAYFQAFTNTYAPTDILKNIYDTVLKFPEIVGISIGTRPDMVDPEKLNLISSYKERYEVWIEYGLQSAHDKTLKLINRGHTFGDFLNAASMTKALDIKVCAHIILGLPGETRQDMIETAKKISSLNIDGIKIHLLHILKGSPLETLYREGKVRLLARDEYIERACDFLENLPENIIIQRLTGEGKRGEHVAPEWALDKTGVIKGIEETLAKRGSRQGSAIS